MNIGTWDHLGYILNRLAIFLTMLVKCIAYYKKTGTTMNKGKGQHLVYI
jgi:hypothetical protein